MYISIDRELRVNLYDLMRVTNILHITFKDNTQILVVVDLVCFDDHFYVLDNKQNKREEQLCTYENQWIIYFFY